MKPTDRLKKLVLDTFAKMEELAAKRDAVDRACEEAESARMAERKLREELFNEARKDTPEAVSGPRVRTVQIDGDVYTIRLDTFNDVFLTKSKLEIV